MRPAKPSRRFFGFYWTILSLVGLAAAASTAPTLPRIAPIPDLSTFAGETTANITFLVEGDETAELTIVAASSDPTLIREERIAVHPLAGPPGERTLRITPEPAVHGWALITLTVSDGFSQDATSFELEIRSDRERVFSNPEPIVIQDDGPGAPYPSVVHVEEVPGTIGKVSVTLDGFTHQFLPDVDILLVSPSGRSSLLMSDTGSGGFPVADLDLTFAPDATRRFQRNPENGQHSGAFRPVEYNRVVPDDFTAPAPAPPYTANLTAFNGEPPNGDWRLFVFDDARLDTGSIARGWKLAVTPGPALVGLTDVAVKEDTPISLDFEVIGAPDPPEPLTFSAYSSREALVRASDLRFSGAGTDSDWKLAFTPVPNAHGEAEIRIRGQYASGGILNQQFTVEVRPVDDPPRLAPVPDQWVETSPFELALGVSDPDTSLDKLEFDVGVSNFDLIQAVGFQVSDETVSAVFDLAANVTGESIVMIYVSDANSKTSQHFRLTTGPRPPSLVVTHRGETAEITLTAGPTEPYLIEDSIDLITWRPLQAVETDGNGRATTFVKASSSPARFYRAHLLEP